MGAIQVHITLAICAGNESVLFQITNMCNVCEYICFNMGVLAGTTGS